MGRSPKENMKKTPA